MALAKEEGCEAECGGHNTYSCEISGEIGDQPFELNREAAERYFPPTNGVFVAGRRMILFGYVHWNLYLVRRSLSVK